MLELNETGEKYLNSVMLQMKDLNIYLDGDEDIMLYDMALQYQLYQSELAESLNEDLDIDDRKNKHMNSMRHLKAVQDMQKQSGLSALQRHKLKAFKEIQEEKSIQDLIAEELQND